MSKKVEVTYKAEHGALWYLYGEPTTGLTIKRKDEWVDLYKGKKKIWGCNDVFFALNFTKEKKNA